jgi:NADP-dependent 3-hydroxy acid dehydrogenase YdfG
MTALVGRTAWITGAGSGIGEAVAIAFAKAGATVALTGRDAVKLEEVASRIGSKAIIVAADVGTRGVAEKAVARILAESSRLDILVNNAGTNITRRRFHDMSEEGIDQVIATNLSGAFYAARAALEPMRARKDGVLIHTGSWAGRFWNLIAGGAYTAAKTAVSAMSHQINLEEHGNGIRSTVVMPAEVATPILNTRPNPPSPEARATMLQPSDMAELYLFIATRPRSVCLNEVVISPTGNRAFGTPRS